MGNPAHCSSSCETEARQACSPGLFGNEPESVARGIFDGVENGDEEIFPDSVSATMAESWRAGVAKELERQNASLVQAEPLAA
jgi:hypothetical protein